MVIDMHITVVRMRAEHIPALAAIEKACFSAPWSEAALKEELQNPLAVFLAAVDENGTVCGYAGMHTVADEGFFANVAVSPTYRRQGAADALVNALSDYGREHNFYRLTLEVRVSNQAAIALYQKHGFICDGVRPHFYTAPDEDAYIYSLYYKRGE